jgi:hypothetical protein
MKTPAHINQATGCVRALIFGLGLFVSGAAQGAALRLTAQVPASAPVCFPVPAAIALENAGNEPIVIEDFPRPHLLRIEIRRVSTGALEYQGFANPLSPLEAPQIPPLTLAPGGTSPFETIFGAKWGPEREPLAPAFTSTGLFSMQFTYGIKYRENGRTEFEYVHSSPVTLLITNWPARQQAALEDVRKMPGVVWLMHPKAADLAGPAELADFETSLRQHLKRHPDSPWASLAKFALASRVYEKFIRAGRQPQALAQEVTNLLNDAQAEGQVYRHDAAQLQKRMEQISKEDRSRAKSKAAPPAAAQPVEAQFKKLLDYMARGDTNFIQPLLLPEFRYNAELNASDWLAKLKREHEETAPFPMAIRFKTVSVAGPEDETVLTADVAFESGVRKSVRRVAATYQLIDKTWLLRDWRNAGVAEP